MIGILISGIEAKVAEMSVKESDVEQNRPILNQRIEELALKTVSEFKDLKNQDVQKRCTRKMLEVRHIDPRKSQTDAIKEAVLSVIGERLAGTPNGLEELFTDQEKKVELAEKANDISKAETRKALASVRLRLEDFTNPADRDVLVGYFRNRNNVDKRIDKDGMRTEPLTALGGPEDIQYILRQYVRMQLSPEGQKKLNKNFQDKECADRALSNIQESMEQTFSSHPIISRSMMEDLRMNHKSCLEGDKKVLVIEENPSDSQTFIVKFFMNEDGKLRLHRNLIELFEKDKLLPSFELEDLMKVMDDFFGEGLFICIAAAGEAAGEAATDFEVTLSEAPASGSRRRGTSSGSRRRVNRFACCGGSPMGD